MKSSIRITNNHRVLTPLRVLVTRPAAQGQMLVDKLLEFDGESLLLPLIEPRALPETQLNKSVILELDRYQKVIFISRPAARFGCELIERYWPQLPAGLQWFAIGQGTAQELLRYDIAADYARRGTDSEALLSLANFARVSDERILLIKGDGGRDHLYQELCRRGASVNSMAVYERHQLDYSPAQIRAELDAHDINVAVVTSGGIAARLGELLLPSYCARLHLVVPSARIADSLQGAGYASIRISDGAGDSAIIESLQQLAFDIGAKDK